MCPTAVNGIPREALGYPEEQGVITFITLDTADLTRGGYARGTLKSRTKEAGRLLGKAGVRVSGSCLLARQGDWVEGHVPRAKLCCGGSKPGGQQVLFINGDSSGSLFCMCQHKTSRNECLRPLKTCLRAFTAALLINSPKLETTQNPIGGEWINKLLFPYSGILLSNEKKPPTT